MGRERERGGEDKKEGGRVREKIEEGWRKEQGQKQGEREGLWEGMKSVQGRLGERALGTDEEEMQIKMARFHFT
jgi:hypothetical protein